MKTIKSLLSVLLAFVLLFSCVSVSFAAGEKAAAKGGFTDEDFLKAKGEYLVNRRGERVVLKGVNLGAWMIWEDWLCPYEGNENNMDMYTVLTHLENRFGRERAYELLNTYMDNFITEYDLDNIKEMGFNCVRAPFWFRNFYYDDQGTKILNDKGEWDFSRLDWLINECSERGIYVILDMHGAVGYQSDAPHSGKGKSCGLYNKTPEGERYRELTCELWTAIAERYRGCSAVAMYDLLNEPMCDVEEPAINRRINNEYIYTLLYKTVSRADPDHVITLECIWTPLALPRPLVKGWTNVCYQVHFYQTSNFVFNLFVILARMYYAEVPMLMGEYYPHGTATWDNCFKVMNACRYNWCLWTYKAAGHGMWSGDWCIMGSKDGFERANVDRDSFEEIARKWGEKLRTEIGYQQSGHYENNVKAFL